MNTRPQTGAALLAVVLALAIAAASSAAFILLMTQQQARAGRRFHSAVALAAAEAGVHRALSILESAAPDGGSGRAWRPTAYTERTQSGPIESQFTIVLTEADAAVVVDSVGEAAGVVERLRARVRLASRALLAALYADGFVHFEQAPATTVVFPYGAGARDLSWVHIAAGQAVWFAGSGVVLNQPSAVASVGRGPADPPGGVKQAVREPSDTLRLLLSRDADLLYGTGYQRVDVQQLRAVGIQIDGTVLRADALPTAPVVDRAFFRARAEANIANAGLNEAAGQYTGDDDLARKQDSFYSQGQFARLQAYLVSGGRPQSVRGMVFVNGRVDLGGQRLQILEGSLIVEGQLTLRGGASLDILHSPATRSLPGLLVLSHGALVVSDGARLRVDGLLYADGPIAIRAGAALDVVGAVVANDYDVSFSNTSATTIIRYDPAVLGTPGLRVAPQVPVVAWVVAWDQPPSRPAR